MHACKQVNPRARPVRGAAGLPGERLTLPDGSELFVRPLRQSDRDGYAAAVLAMSDRSRYLRFAAPTPRLSAQALDLLTSADGDTHVALLALAGTPPRGIAVARYVRAADGSAEVAIGVIDAWQGRGVGRLLLSKLLDHARAHDVPALTAMTLAENAASVRLLQDAGFRLERREGITSDYRLALRARPPSVVAAPRTRVASGPAGGVGGGHGRREPLRHVG